MNEREMQHYIENNRKMLEEYRLIAEAMERGEYPPNELENYELEGLETYE